MVKAVLKSRVTITKDGLEVYDGLLSSEPK